MDTKKFLNLVVNYRWLVIAIPIISLLITYLLIKDLPKQYKSEAKLSTGLLDPSRQVAPDVPSYSGPDLLIKLNQQFTNIMDIMAMPKNMSILSYRLIIHDLQNPQAPFKQLSDDVKRLSATQRIEAIRQFQERIDQRLVLTPLDNYDVKFYNLVKSMGYDEKTLKKNLVIDHEANSDFIKVEYTSNNTLFSVFVVNTLAQDFIKNYTIDLIENKNNSILVLDSLLQKKEAIMNERNQQLKSYKIRNGVLNLDKQSQILYQQITDSEIKRNQSLVNREALLAALKNVNDNLNKRYNERYLGAELSVDNQAITNLRAKLQAAESKYLDGGYKPTDKRKVDSLQALLSAQLIRTNDNYVSDPLIAKQSLIQQRIDIGIELDKTAAGLKDLEVELKKLNAKFTAMVPFDAEVQKYERDADVATKEYLEILNRYNQTNLDKNIGLRLQLAQEGVPSLPETSKKPIFMALSLVASIAICFGVLFLIYLLDQSINNEKQLAEITNGNVIGHLNYLQPNDRNLEAIWKNDENLKTHLVYKNHLRNIRFDIYNLLTKENLKVLGITSLGKDKLKHFTTISLAYAFACMDKSVLIIGNEELGKELSQLYNIPINQTFKALGTGETLKKSNPLTFLNNDLNESVFENRDQTSTTQIFDKFKAEFDLVLMQLEPLNSMYDINEWKLFTDKYLATFMAGNAVSDTDKAFMQSLKKDDKFLGWIIDGVKQS